MSIRVDVTPLLKDVGRSLKIDEEEKVSYPEDNLILTSPVHIKGEFLNTGDVILFKGNVKTTVKLNCAYCLNDFDHPLDFDFEEEYGLKSGPGGEGAGERKLIDEDFIFAVEPDNTINLSEVVRQNILTELPIRPLCQKGCSLPEEKDKEAQ